MATLRELERQQKKLYRKYCHLEKQISSGQTNGYKYITQNYNELINTTDPAPVANDFAYVKTSQGTQWLPGGLGGTYYGSGVYFYDGSVWINDKSQIAAQLQINIDDIVNIESEVGTLSTQITGHILDLNNPHETPTSGGDVITDVRTEDTVDVYYRGFNRNGSWEIEKYNQNDINNFVVANQINNGAYSTLDSAWTNRGILTYT